MEKQTPKRQTSRYKQEAGAVRNGKREKKMNKDCAESETKHIFTAFHPW